MHYTMIYVRKLTHSMFYLKLQNVAYINVKEKQSDSDQIFTSYVTFYYR